ncbi:baseplate J family protein [Listeria phage LIS04]|nr:baseplate J family protein [Listeria phage LIS04]
MALDNREYSRSIEDLIAKATELNPQWTQFTQSDIGITMLKLLASQSHVVDFYTKHYLDNLYLPSDNPEFIYEMLGYKPAAKYTTILSARVDWLTCGPDEFIYFPKYTPLKVTADSKTYNFLTTQDYYLRQYSSRVIMDMIHGELVEIKIVRAEVKNNKYLISDKDIDMDTVTFTVDGSPWDKVKNIYYEEGGCIFSVHLEDDGTYIYLQDGWEDRIPSDVSEIVITAIVIPEQFDTNTKNCSKVEFGDSIKDSKDNDITDNFKLHLLDRTLSDESDSKFLAKDRVITLDDFEFQSMMFPGVVAVKCYDWDTYHKDLGINRPFYVKVVVTGESANLSSQLKSSIQRRLKSMTFQNIEVEVVDPVRIKYSPTILANIGQYKGTYQESEIYQSIRAGLQSYFELGNLEIGKPIDLKALYSKIYKEDSRIKYVEWEGYKELSINPLEIPVLGTVTVKFDVEASMIFDLGYSNTVAHVGPFNCESPTSTETASIEVYQLRSDESESESISKFESKQFTNRDSTQAEDEFTLDNKSEDSSAADEDQSLEE